MALLRSTIDNSSTIHYAEGKEVVIVSEEDVLLEDLKRVGVQKIVTHIDLYRTYDLGV
ncbi:hypothetical protein [Sphingobacterium suaedae]|uniref:Uncharacterized protein n=1 Tax=Sphingobacterium suaedae TaxID=1686402 RepID=A0ABW5KHQ0_9SPHI